MDRDRARDRGHERARDLPVAGQPSGDSGEPRPAGADELRFCPRCAARFGTRVIGGLPRLACAACGFVLYRNPIVGVAVILIEGASILLSRRARGAWAGMWDIPGGIVEWDEEIRDAARRELLEETGLRVEIGPVYEVHSNFHDPRQHTVGVWFRGSVIDGTLAPDDDVAELRYFPLDALPEEIAFETDRRVLARLREESR